jgi:hypothetical protein
MTKIAVMGSAPSSKDLAPFSELEWEIWCCSPPNYNNPRVDAWFELHNLCRKIGIPQNKPYTDTLLMHPRVYIAERDNRLPNGIKFPWRELVAEFGDYFFTSSVAWMLAFAIVHKPEKIGLWGVDMSAHEEYGYQRAGCHHFIQIAKDRGIGIYAPPTSDILQGVPLYGIKEQWPMWAKFQARKQELLDRKHKAEQAIEAASSDLGVFRGALDDMQYQENTWLQPDWRDYLRKEVIIESLQQPVGAQPDPVENGSQPTDKPSEGRKKRSGVRARVQHDSVHGSKRAGNSGTRARQKVVRGSGTPVPELS